MVEEGERKNRPVLVDFGQLKEEMGRELTKEEGEAVAIMTDSLACGRPFGETIENIEKAGRTVSKKAKQILGLGPRPKLIIPGPPEETINN